MGCVTNPAITVAALPPFQKRQEDVIEKEERQPQLSLDSCESSDNCGSKRRRVLDKKEDCFEDTNSMKKRLEGDDWIE